MKRLTTLVILLPLLTLTSINSFAWGKKGHEMIAQIAYRYMDDSTRKIVQSFLGKISFEEAANWMDDEKSNSYYNYMRTWHYVNVEKGDKYTPSTTRDIVTVLNSAILDLKNYKDPSKKKDIKRDLLLIFHLVGDLHQPMHVGYGSDRGGNSVEVTSPVVSGNLHSIWDGQIIDYRGITLDSALSIYPTLSPEAIVEIQKVNVISWMRQSRVLLDTAYSFQNNFLSKEYVDSNAEVTKRQLLIGGMRLASILTEAFKKQG